MLWIKGFLVFIISKEISCTGESWDLKGDIISYCTFGRSSSVNCPIDNVLYEDNALL